MIVFYIYNGEVQTQKYISDIGYKVKVGNLLRVKKIHTCVNRTTFMHGSCLRTPANTDFR